MRQLQVQEVTSNSKQILDSEESGHRNHSGSDCEGRKPDWKDYYPKIKVPVQVIMEQNDRAFIEIQPGAVKWKGRRTQRVDKV